MSENLKLLLHSCCGPCSTAVIERLLSEGEYDITVFYYNPNITDPEEYEHRKQEQIRFIKEYTAGINKIRKALAPEPFEGHGYEPKLLDIPFIEGEYKPEEYFEMVSGFEQEPEGGLRCGICFSMRLEATAKYAKEHGFDCFDTTLSVSPYKNYDVISDIGRQLDAKYGITYLSGNYKKRDGYKRSTELSREFELYRQHYCGCEFSKRDV